MLIGFIGLAKPSIIILSIQNVIAKSDSNFWPGFISNDPVQGQTLTGTIKLPFHSDSAYGNPHNMISLQAVDVVESEISTKFANMIMGYSTLPVDLKKKVQGLNVSHRYPLSMSALRYGQESLEDDTPEFFHPAVLFNA